MITAIEKEIVLREHYIQEKVNTVYFGGGTPSLLAPAELERILVLLRKTFHIDTNAEITLEANPDDIDDTILESWKVLGVNRLSIGIQTFDDKVLRYLNRIHSSEDAVRSVESALRYGFVNFNIDLIYALPSANHSIFLQDLNKVIDLKPNHISAYNLTIEPKTVFGNWLRKGKISEMDEDFSTEQYWLLCDSLRDAGYEHYEVSNFSLPGFQSKHNTSYWKGISYLGLGPGAHSFNGSSRQINKPNNAFYIKSLLAGEVPSTIENLGNEEMVNEYLLTRLRTMWGIDIKLLQNNFNYKLNPSQQGLIEQLLKKKMAIMEGTIFKLNEKGYLLADQIALELGV